MILSNGLLFAFGSLAVAYFKGWSEFSTGYAIGALMCGLWLGFVEWLNRKAGKP